MSRKTLAALSALILVLGTGCVRGPAADGPRLTGVGRHVERQISGERAAIHAIARHLVEGLPHEPENEEQLARCRRRLYHLLCGLADRNALWLFYAARLHVVDGNLPCEPGTMKRFKLLYGSEEIERHRIRLTRDDMRLRLQQHLSLRARPEFYDEEVRHFIRTSRRTAAKWTARAGRCFDGPVVFAAVARAVLDDCGATDLRGPYIFWDQTYRGLDEVRFSWAKGHDLAQVLDRLVQLPQPRKLGLRWAILEDQLVFYPPVGVYHLDQRPFEFDFYKVDDEVGNCLFDTGKTRRALFFLCAILHRGRVRKLQKLVGANVDGAPGSQTLACVLRFLAGTDERFQRNAEFIKESQIGEAQYRDLWRLVADYEQRHGFPRVGRVDLSRTFDYSS